MPQDVPCRFALELRGVSKSFGAVQTLRPLTLSLPEGELLAVLGPSGLREDDDVADRGRVRGGGHGHACGSAGGT